MSAYIDRILSDDFLWETITTHLQSRRRRTSTGFIRYDCPMCIARGTGADKKGRGGVKRSGEGIGVNCFNCGFRTKYVPGSLLPGAFREFLGAIGVPDEEVKRIAHRAFQNRQAVTRAPEIAARLPEAFTPDWKTAALPEGARPILDWVAEGCEDENLVDVVTYLYTERGDALAEAYPYAWSPSTNRGMNRRVIIPFLHEGRVVGYTARAIDENAPGGRYHMEAPENFIFNADALARPERKFGIFLEGGFDAIGLDACALMGAHLNAQQVGWIKSFGKTNIVVPDRDKRGEALIEVALKNSWHVAFPSFADGRAAQRWWAHDCKDAAEAVRRYGRPYTLTSIIRTATANPMEIGVKRKWLY